MVEYIEREAALDAAKKSHLYFDLKPIINSIPAVDVRLVVKGTWAGIDDFLHEDWECDNCGCIVTSTNDPWNYYHFCPNCGADMRECET